MSEFTIITKQILKIVYKKKENSTKHYDLFQNSFPFIKEDKKSLTKKDKLYKEENSKIINFSEKT